MDTYYDASREIHVGESISRHKLIHDIQVLIRISVSVMTVIDLTNVCNMIGKYSARYDPSTLYSIITIRCLKVSNLHKNVSW